VNNLVNRADFPTLERTVGSQNVPLHYLDSAATALKPRQVINATSDFYTHHNGSAGRGAHTLANEAGEIVEATRQKLLQFAGANSAEYEAIWTSGATESLNIIANIFLNATLEQAQNARQFILEPGSNIILSIAEHHANIVPWQEVARKVGAELRYLDVDDSGRIVVESVTELLDKNTRAISVTHASNVTGAVTDIPRLLNHVQEKCRALGTRMPVVVLDACQSAPHIPLEVDALGVDFVAFSAHKMYGPSGLGAIIAKRAQLDAAPVVKTGGGMVELVEKSTTTFLPLPNKFEPGSYNTAGIAGFGAALEYLDAIGSSNIIPHEAALLEQLFNIREIPGVQIIGKPWERLGAASPEQLGVVSFNLEGVHPHDLSQVFDELGVAVRVGHHCAQLIHRRFGFHASCRASLGIYSTLEDVNALVDAIREAKEFFKH
jgi:cysteine desulfurase/selenocysteine lyase